MNRYEMNICLHVSKLNELQASKKQIQTLVCDFGDFAKVT